MGYKEMPDAVRVPGLTPVTKLALVAITGHANREKGCAMWHSSSSIATEIGVSKKAVLAAYKTLEDLGLITRKEQNHVTPSGNVRRGSDIITVHFDRIKALADGRNDGEFEGGGNHSSPGVVTTVPQGGNESSPHNRETNKEPEQVNSFTGKADALTPREAIGEHHWKSLLDHVQAMAADQWSAEAADDFEGTLREATQEDIADWQVNYFHTPPKTAVDRKLAGKWLNTMFKKARAEGFDYAPATI